MRELFEKKVIRFAIFAALAAAVIISIGLAALVREIPIAETDIAISTELQKNVSIFFDTILRVVSFLGDPLMAAAGVIVTAIILIALQYQREALFMLLIPAADFVGTVIKNIVARPRPSDLFITIYEQASGSSFPSGHVIHATVFFGYLFVLMFVVKKLPSTVRIVIAIFSLLMIMLMSVSRVYLGAHWASDVIGGYLVGFVLLVVLLLAYLNVTNPKKMRRF